MEYYSMCHPALPLVYLPTWSMHEDHVDAKEGRSDGVDDEDDVDHLDLQCVSWLSFIEYYAVWSMLCARTSCLSVIRKMVRSVT